MFNYCSNCYGCGEVVVEYKIPIYDLDGKVVREETHIKWETCPVCNGTKEVKNVSG